MTEQEKSAYDHAAKRAEATLLIVEALAGGALAWFAGISSAAQKGVLFAVGYVPGKIYVGEFREKLLQSMIDYEYRLDGMDGKYDGIVDPNYRHNI
jgi:L-amino acid N-acyltransferase YncA